MIASMLTILGGEARALATRRAAPRERATRRGACTGSFAAHLGFGRGPARRPLGGPDVETGSEASPRAPRRGPPAAPARSRSKAKAKAASRRRPCAASRRRLRLADAAAPSTPATPIRAARSHRDAGLAVALAYMNPARTFGVVQLLVFLSVNRLSRAKQVAVLWLWVAALGVGARASFRRFMRPGGVAARGNDAATGEGEGAPAGHRERLAAVSPTLAFWPCAGARVSRGVGRGRVTKGRDGETNARRLRFFAFVFWFSERSLRPSRPRRRRLSFPRGTHFPGPHPPPRRPPNESRRSVHRPFGRLASCNSINRAPPLRVVS